jgi:hypothetical protein
MKLQNTFVVRSVAWMATKVIQGLFRTYSISVYELAPGTNPYAETRDEQYIYHVWHDMILPSIFCGKQRKVAALTSQHRDGEYVVELLKAAGITPIRGSSKKGGVAATKFMMSAISDHHIVITPDGPRGPRRKAKHGLIFLASVSGRKIIPTGFYSQRAWYPKGSWTDLMVPYPFSKLIAVCGEPVTVAVDLTDAEYEEYTLYLEQACWHAEQQAQLICQGKLTQPQPLGLVQPARRPALLKAS